MHFGLTSMGCSERNAIIFSCKGLSFMVATIKIMLALIYLFKGSNKPQTTHRLVSFEHPGCLSVADPSRGEGGGGGSQMTVPNFMPSM